MTPVYTLKLDFLVPKTDIKTQNINKSFLQIFKIIIASF